MNKVATFYNESLKPIVQTFNEINKLIDELAIIDKYDYPDMRKEVEKTYEFAIFNQDKELQENALKRMKQVKQLLIDRINYKQENK